jgi:hypothetical protein
LRYALSVNAHKQNAPPPLRGRKGPAAGGKVGGELADPSNFSQSSLPGSTRQSTMDPPPTTAGTFPLSEPKAPIASIALLGHPAEGAPFAITVEIGTPYKFLESPEEWACPLNVHPLMGKPRDIHGGDSLQVLSLALRVVGDDLQHFIDKGGTLRYADGSEFDLDPYMLGTFSRKTK